MDSVTETILDEEVPQARLGLLLKHFSQLDDAREPWRVVYPLGETLRTQQALARSIPKRHPVLSYLVRPQRLRPSSLW
jgi:hypothetical protein